MATEDDDEELTFDAEQPQAEKPKAEPQPEPAPAEAEAVAETPAAEPAPTPAAEAKPTEAEPAEPAAAPSRKPSRSGMAIAACLGICVITSTLAAVQSWRAASLAAAAGGGSTKDVIAKLNALQTLMEQQRDAIDELATRPGLAAASASPQSLDGQINALAAAVKANQQMAEQLPSVVMKQVDARLARVETRRAAPAPSPRPQAARPAVQRSTAPKRAPEQTAEAAKVLSTPIVPTNAEKKRPAGEAISYP